jgi:flagellin-like hook-associated protein FlgL
VVTRIGTNIDALRAERQLNDTSLELASVFERLSSGQRLNKASDDAAGLAIASSLNADGKVYTQAIRNLNDGLSAINIIDGALQQGSNIIAREKELAEQSANGSYSNRQRTAMDTEAQALRNEYNRIMASTSFDGLNLLDGSVQSITLQAGYGSAEQLVVPVSNYATFGGTTTSAEVVGSGTFQAGVSYAIGAAPGALVVADLNGDGKPDLVTTAGGVNKAIVQLGNGNGTFNAGVSYATGSIPVAVTVADLNGDGKPDLITSDYIANKVSVQLGNGNGTFGTRTSYSTGTNPNSLIAVDLNGDGKLDLVTADFAANKASVYLGNGNGTFGARASYSTGGNPESVIAVDVNGDGKLDLVTADNFDNTISVQLGNGNGTFNARASYPTGGSPQSVTAADLNSDGKLDLVTVDTSDSAASVYLGNGNGTFNTLVQYATGGTPQSITAADVNGDGKVDLIDVDFADSRASIQLGNGNGTFAARTSYVTGANPFSVSATDLNGDGIRDLVTTDSNEVGVFLGNGTAPVATSGIADFTLSSFSLATQGSSRSALDCLSTALANLETTRGQFGALQSRIQTAISNLSAETTQYKAAESRIVDDNTAADSAELTRLVILQQAGQAVLAQANQQPQLALQLLRG